MEFSEIGAAAGLLLGGVVTFLGVMALAVRWETRGFLVFAAALLPFFWFNYHFHYVEPVLTSIGMLDFAGNAVMLVLALLGWRAARKEAAA